jgi:predicted nucleic acid-binding protein
MPNALVFVDSNVFVYAHDARDGVKQRVAREWIDRLWIDQCGKTSVQVINEFYTTVTRGPKPLLTMDQAWGNVQILLGWRPLALDVELLGCARAVQHSYRLSWWDSMIVAAAQVQSCATLLTEDLQNGAFLGTVRVVNPFASEIHDEQASYIVKPTSRHRPRGRPRKHAA